MASAGSPKFGSQCQMRVPRPICTPKASTFRKWQANDSRSQSEPAIEAVLAEARSRGPRGRPRRLERAEKTEAELRYLADHDSLTGLLDRRRFRAELDQYVSFTARYGGQGAVMIIDIDGLKAVNDSLGHHAGDNLIRQVAGILRERVRATDIVARLSGDEFAVLMPQTDTDGRAAARRGPARPGRRERPAGAGGRAGDDQRRDHDVRRRARRSAPRRSWSPPTRRCTGPRRRGATRSPSSATRDEPRARRQRRQTTTRADPRRAHPRPPQPSHAADPQPRLRRDRALRAAAADDRRRRRAAARGLLHRGGGALRHGPGARPLGRRPRPRAARRARARRRAGLSPRQPLRRLADRPLGARVHRAPPRRRRRRPRRAAPSRSPRRRGSTTTTRPPASPTA